MFFILNRYQLYKAYKGGGGLVEEDEENSGKKTEEWGRGGILFALLHPSPLYACYAGYQL